MLLLIASTTFGWRRTRQFFPFNWWYLLCLCTIFGLENKHRKISLLWFTAVGPTEAYALQPVKRRNYASDPKSFRGPRTYSRSSITVPNLVRLGFHPPRGQPKMIEFFRLSACLSVCLSVMLLNVRDCAPDFAMKALEYRNDFDTVG